MPGMQQFSAAVNRSSSTNHHTNHNSNNNNFNYSEFASSHNNNNSNLHTPPKMHSLDLNASFAIDAMSFAPNPANASPPEFDFSLPCRLFKSSFARSLSLNNASNHHCRSLDFDINSRSSSGSNSSNSSSNNNNTDHSNFAAKHPCPPLPSRPSRAGTPANCNNSSSNNNYNNVSKNEVSCCDVAKPPAIPARRPVPTAVAFDMTANTQTHHNQQQQQQQHQQQSLTQLRHVAAAAVAAASSSPPSSVGNNAGNSNAVAAHGNFNKVINHTPKQQQQQQLQQRQQSNISSNSNFRRNIVWPRDNVEQDCNLSDEAEQEDAINTPNYAPAEHHRGGGCGGVGAPFEVHHDSNNTMNVEAVILQNQVDTLQWQLKQVETSCEMYRAVMEEVARFLDRYHSQKQQLRHLQLQQQQQNRIEQISRSKSLYHVYGGGGGHEKNNPPSGDEAPTPAAYPYLRARSSTNIIEPPLGKTSSAVYGGGVCSSTDDHNHDVIAPSTTNSYSAFKDFTWRRTPKKLNDCRTGQLSTESSEDKLNQEAFRLSRTIQNLLNTSTQQPDLTHHRNTLATGGSSNLGRLSSSSTMALLTTPMLVETPAAAPVGTPKNNSLSADTAAEMLFLRTANMRDSSLSLRSSTDSSVHSTISSAASSSSSSKVETDEEGLGLFHVSPGCKGGKQMHLPQLGSTTEDESGFSSISSFQDIGVPLSSTLLSNAPTQPPVSRHTLATIALVHAAVNGEAAAFSREFHHDSRNSTLKAVTAITPGTASVAASAHCNNEVGVPTHDMQHRWDAPPAKTSYRSAAKCQRFSTLSNEDSAAVLWV